MSRLKKDPLRPFRPEERLHLERLSRALGLPAALVARAKVLANRRLLSFARRTRRCARGR